MDFTSYFSTMILSASGWRMVFALSDDTDGLKDVNRGLQESRQILDEQSHSKNISEYGKLICFAVAQSFTECFSLKKGDRILLARDSRPTGEIICNIVWNTLLNSGFIVDYPGICSAPEVMAESSFSSYNAFFYVSASHNPVGHNGFKFGKNGGVFSQKEISNAITVLKKKIADEALLKEQFRKLKKKDLKPDEKIKKNCLSHYMSLLIGNIGSSKEIEIFRTAVKKKQIGICVDFNGSARCSSIDKDFLAYLGFKTCFINDSVGQIVHEIIPENENLLFCKNFLEKKYKEDNSFVIGYVPDNDGDRGNVVYISSDKNAKILQAQEVFALCVDSTLKNYYKRKEEGREKKPLAVVVNGPTSVRIDEIAEKYNAKVFRSEVGEANVVNLAKKLRSEGYAVPILGEGSNGGNITYPQEVRDPLSTVLCLTGELLNGEIENAIKNLPQFITTGTTDEKAVLYLKTNNYKELKKLYEKIFVKEFNEKKDKLSYYGIREWKEFQTVGVEEKQSVSESEKGGLKICFYSDKKSDNGFRINSAQSETESFAIAGTPSSFIWMRPSGTEPLFRVIADVKVFNQNFQKANELYEYLITWHREMIIKAQNQLLLQQKS